MMLCHLLGFVPLLLIIVAICRSFEGFGAWISNRKDDQ